MNTITSVAVYISPADAIIIRSLDDENFTKAELAEYAAAIKRVRAQITAAANRAGL